MPEYHLAAKHRESDTNDRTPRPTVVRVGDKVLIGGGELVVIAAPCAVEGRDMLRSTARAVRESGGVMLRGGAFKPRTSPYAFRGLGEEALALLSEARGDGSSGRDRSNGGTPTPAVGRLDRHASDRRAPHFCALRGATSVAADHPELVTEAVTELLDALLRSNDLTTRGIVSAIFSATADLHNLYPAAVAHALGWTELPMLCVSEMQVDSSPRRCIRILLHLSLRSEHALRPVYLREAHVCGRT